MEQTVSKILLLAGLLATLAACSPSGPGGLSFSNANSPHEQYERALRTTNLDRSALGIDWVTASQKALRDSLKITVPYRESGYFPADRVFAAGYVVEARRGDKLIVKLEVQGKETVGVFVDVFELGDREPVLLDATRTEPTFPPNTGTELTLIVRRTRPYLIWIQPELLRSGRYTLSVTREPVLSFPVKGRDSWQISSFFGVPRDGGQRRHEGIDIFAPKGTPALAAINGVVSGVGTNNLGGNVAWLSDSDLGLRLYYAHLDRWHVTAGQRVSVGDTIGFVGNTGNARTTGPHLHFGIYGPDATTPSGALDPLPFVQRGPGPARQSLLSANRLGDSVRVSTTKGLLRAGPNGDALLLRQLPKATALTIIGGTADWLRVRLPDGLTGYVAVAGVESAKRALRQLPLTAPAPLLDAADSSAAVIATLPAGSRVAVLASAGAFRLVRTAAGPTGWLLNI